MDLDSLKKSISEMTIEELQEELRKIRGNRRSNATVKTPKKKKEKDLLSGLSQEDMNLLLAALEGDSSE